MSLECAVFIVGVIIQVTAFTSWVQVMVGRFISGLGVGGLSAAVPVVRSRTRLYGSREPLILPTSSTKLKRPRLKFVEQ